MRSIRSWWLSRTLASEDRAHRTVVQARTAQCNQEDRIRPTSLNRLSVSSKAGNQSLPSPGIDSSRGRSGSASSGRDTARMSRDGTSGFLTVPSWSGLGSRTNSRPSSETLLGTSVVASQPLSFTRGGTNAIASVPESTLWATTALRADATSHDVA